MDLVGFTDGDIIQRINGARDQAKRKEGEKFNPEKLRVKQVFLKNQGCEEEKILDPLLRSEKGEERGHG